MWKPTSSFLVSVHVWADKMALLLYGRAFSVGFLSKGPRTAGQWQDCHSTGSRGKTCTQFRLLTGVLAVAVWLHTGPQSPDAEGEKR